MAVGAATMPWYSIRSMTIALWMVARVICTASNVLLCERVRGVAMPTVHDWGEGEELSARHERQLECSPHTWVANSGRGGEPEYRPNRQMSTVPLMHVQCSKCNARTWFSEKQWQQLTQSENSK